MFDDLKFAPKDEDEMEDFRDYGDEGDDVDSKLDDYEDDEDDDEDEEESGTPIAVMVTNPPEVIAIVTVETEEEGEAEDLAEGDDLPADAPPERKPAASAK